MSIYRRDDILPEWEAAPWPMDADEADKQEQGFYDRAQIPIRWQPIPWKAFPDEGVFGHQKDWLSSVDAAFFATVGEEDFLLIENTWSGWPDPPRWGLASRPRGQNNQWDRWGHFPNLPPAWNVPATSD
jgi:hypothetical protein